MLLAIIPIFSASCSIFGEGKAEEEKKITLKARNGEMIDCTPRLYQDYLAVTSENDAARRRLDGRGFSSD